MSIKDNISKTLKTTKLVIILMITTLILSVLSYYLFNGITTSKGITSITPINVAENGFFCKTKSVTAARSSDSGSFIISSNGLKYNILDETIYLYLEKNIGKTVVVNYEKKSWYHNPCLTSEYIITKIIIK